MGLTKVTYVDKQTIISADNLNDIQDAIIALQNTSNGGSSGESSGSAVGIASVVQTTTSTADDGNNIITVTLTDGTTSTFKVQNGSKGSTGTAGYTPVKGTDYFTAADKAELVDDVLAALPTWTGGSY